MNFFNKEIKPINIIIEDNEVNAFIKDALSLFFGSIEIPKQEIHIYVSEVFEKLQKYSNISDYEKIINDLIFQSAKIEGIERGLDERARIAVKQVLPNLKPGDLLDFGCGDGLMASLIAEKGYDVSLADIYKHEKIDKFGFNFNLIGDREKTSFGDDEFDNVLLYTVLHHAVDPVFSLEEVLRITKKGGRIIIIESLFGSKEYREFKTTYPMLHELSERFMKANHEQQFEIDMFFDHLFNRCLFYTDVLEEKISVPYNYLTLEKWEELFISKKLKVLAKINLGIDQRIAPLFHTMFVLEK